MGRFDCLGHLLRDCERLFDAERSSLDTRGKCLARDELEYEKALAVRFLEAVNAGDVRMIQRREEVRFTAKPREAFRVP
jgi:hypothetical protein